MAKKDKNKELEIIVEEGIEVEILGNKYKMRRLNTRDVFTFSKLLSKAIKNYEGSSISSDEAFALALISGMADNDEEVAKFYGSLLGMSAEEFFNQPSEFLNEFLEVLPKHYDLESFFITVLKTIQTMATLWQK